MTIKNLWTAAIFGLMLVQDLDCASASTNRGLNWKVFEQFIIKRRTYDQETFQATFKDGIHIPEDNAIPYERKRKGPFLSMFPGSASKDNDIFDEDVGQPLILTPFLESGQVEKARELSMVKNLSTSSSSARIETYSGFLTVNKTYDSNLFFWYAPAQFSEKAPLILWLQGGPGGSSLFGFFIEHGPFYVTDQLELKKRSTAWSLPYNVLYIDQPVGTGFSYTKNELGYATNQEMVANDLYEALNQFYTMFPDLLDEDFYVTGESYAGKYVPAIAYKIHQMNSQPDKEMTIPLKGLAIGDGLCDPLHQMDYGDFLYQVGLLDDSDKAEVDKHADLAKISMELEQWHQATIEFDNILDIVENRTGLTFYYNYLLSKQPAEFDNYPKFLEKPEVRRAIHVGNLTYHDISLVAHQHLFDDMSKTIRPWLETLLESDYKVMIYNGQLDVIIAFPQTENFLNALDWSGKYIYAMTPRTIWKVRGDVAGYVRKAKNLTQVMVRNAGHILPFDQPKWAFDMIQRFIQDKDF